MAKNLLTGAAASLVLLSLTGCQLFSKIEPYTNTVSTQSVAIGILNPVAAYVPFDDQLLLTVFVSDAAEISNIEEAPVIGAEVDFRSSEAESAVLDAAEDGLYYTIAGSSEVAYETGSLFQMTVVADGVSYLSQATAPAPASVDEAGSCINPGEAQTFHVSGGPYERLVAVVVNQEGNETWSNLPEGTQEIVDFITSDDAGTTLSIPGTAFPNAESIYGVVIAGVNQGGTYSDTLNPLLSRFFVGGGTVGVIGTFSSAELCANLPK